MTRGSVTLVVYRKAPISLWRTVTHLLALDRIRAPYAEADVQTRRISHFFRPVSRGSKKNRIMVMEGRPFFLCRLDINGGLSWQEGKQIETLWNDVAAKRYPTLYCVKSFISVQFRWWNDLMLPKWPQSKTNNLREQSSLRGTNNHKRTKEARALLSPEWEQQKRLKRPLYSSR